MPDGEGTIEVMFTTAALFHHVRVSRLLSAFALYRRSYLAARPEVPLSPVAVQVSVTEAVRAWAVELTPVRKATFMRSRVKNVMA
jgi:hypothetical protein